MESSMQKIIAAIVGVLMFFIIPVYIAFEKIDDISYTLALKLTQNFVDNVRVKGYISPEMYSEFVSGLYATGNSYDIEIQHIKKRYDPAIYVYSAAKEVDQHGNETGRYTRGTVITILDYAAYKAQLDSSNAVVVGSTTYKSGENCYIEKAHTINEEIITDKQIVDKLFKNTGITKSKFLQDCLMGNIETYKSLRYFNENSYLLNEGDQINVRVKNRNQTVASVLYSSLTANVNNEDVARIYVEYGGSIKNSGDGIILYDTGSVDSEEGKLFKYTGGVQEITLEPGIYKMECWGAAGGHPDNMYDGITDTTKYCYGGYIMSKFSITEETTMYVYVGGKGSLYSATNTNNGGYNGGGNSVNGYGGGGATDIRLLKGDATDIKSLLTRVIVAGGGGGCSGVSMIGYGGAATSTVEPYSRNGWPRESDYEGIGGKLLYEGEAFVGYTDAPESAGGTLGLGGSVDYGGAGAGGSGYCGGSAAWDSNAGGGAGYTWVATDYTRDSYMDNYPFPEFYVTKYSPAIDSEIDALVETRADGYGYWKGVTSLYNTVGVSEPHKFAAGYESMPDPLLSTVSGTMIGNSGNGYARITKVL